VLFTYLSDLLDRAGRRESLVNKHRFVCNCELCALPDDLSNAFDTKIKLANEASDRLDRFYFKGQVPAAERDIIRVVHSLDTFMSIIIWQRLFFDYQQLFWPLRIFQAFARPTLLQRVAQAIIRVLRRYLGTGSSKGAGVEFVTSFLKDEIDSFLLEAQLEKTASTIISNLQSLP
jgi:hypothetical protein